MYTALLGKAVVSIILHSVAQHDEHSNPISAHVYTVDYMYMSVSFFPSMCYMIPPYCTPRRGLNPPHRVKSISMTTFSENELELLKNGGNEVSEHLNEHGHVHVHVHEERLENIFRGL